MKLRYGSFASLAMLLFVVVSTRAATLPPGNYVLAQIDVDGAGTGKINSIGQVLVAEGVWTPVVANSNVGRITAINGAGSFGGIAINNRGQITGRLCQSSSSCQIVLWSPASPNGTTGSVVALPLSFTPLAINSIGQVVDAIHLWTPSPPNGASGTLTDFTGITGSKTLIAGINDFGQIVVNEADLSVPHLFTPTTANGSTGALTPLPGMGSIVAVNNRGMVLGAGSDSSGRWHGYLWTPTSPNGTAGTVSEIPIPAGFTQLRPWAFNDSGQVVGWFMQSATTCAPSTCGSMLPFLYTGGTVYDLSAVDSRLSGALWMAVNAAGQITLGDALEHPYLLSPTTPPAPPGPQTVANTVASLPSGRGFIVSGNGCSPGAYLSPQTFNWIPQSNCTVAFVSPQNDEINEQYIFSAWQDGSTANPRAIVAPAQPATYTANLTTQYLVTVFTDPPEGGTVSGGGWCNANSTVVLTATPASGFRFAGWSSVPAVSAVGPDSASITVSGSPTITAEFAAIAGPALTNYTVTVLGSVLPGYPTSLNSFGQVVFGSSLWTPFTPNGITGAVSDLGFIAAGINSRGQITGTSGSGQALLWSPDMPNGSSGSEIPVPAASPPASLAVGINNFGQMIGESGGLIVPWDAVLGYAGSFLWTPSVPNGATGTVDAGVAGDHFVAINNAGQAINPTGLYTPPAPNLAAILGQPGSNNVQLTALNDRGVIAGATYSCSSSCSPAGFLWTPDTPNGSVGAASPLPVPAGYLYLNPAALNNSGQVLGIMTQANGVRRPFLYMDGAVYDLGTVSSQFSTAIPAALNDSGQIVLALSNGPASNTMYLLTPVGQTPALTLSHIGNFTQGQPVATFTISVQNNTAAPTTGTITVTDTLPLALSAAAVYAPGWTCTLVPLTCTRSDSLAAGASYPPIAVTVGVAYGAPPQVTNRALLSGSIPAIVATDTIYIAVPFADVSTADPFLPAIDLLRQYGVTSGCGSSPPTYCPSDDISRGQMSVLIVRAVMGGDNFTYTEPPYFTDVPANHPYFKWIQKMRDLGITSGCSAAAYCPDDFVTRGEMAVFIIRARYGASTTFAYPSTPLFTDVPASNSFFRWIQKMMQAGITSGCGPGTYCPNDPVTREEMAVFIVRGAFNQLLPANTPVVALVSPAKAFVGQSLTVTITGQNTNFIAGATQVTFGAGITVNSVSVANATTLTAELTVNGDAVPGPQSITVTTGAQEATLPNAFRVQ